MRWALLALLAVALALAPRAGAAGEPLYYVTVSAGEDGWYLISAPGGPWLPYDYENGTLLPYVLVGTIDGNFTMAVWLPAGEHVIELRNESPSYIYGGEAETRIKYIYDKGNYRSAYVYSTGDFAGTAVLGYKSLAILRFSGYQESWDSIGILGDYYGFSVKQLDNRNEFRVSVSTSSGTWTKDLWPLDRLTYFVVLGDGVSRYYVLTVAPNFATTNVFLTQQLSEETVYRFYAASYSEFQLGLLIETVHRPEIVLSTEPPSAGGGGGSWEPVNVTTSWLYEMGYGCGDPRKPTVAVYKMPPVFPAGQIGGEAGEHVELHAYWVTSAGLPWLVNGTVVWLGNVSLADYQCVYLWIGWSQSTVSNITDVELSGELVVPVTPASFKAYRRGWPAFPLDAQLPDWTGPAYFVAANVFETPYWRVIVWTSFETTITEGEKQGFIGRLLAALLEPLKSALEGAATAVVSALPEPVRQAVQSIWSLALAVLHVVGSFLSQLPGYVAEYSRLLVALAPLIVLSLALEPELFIRFIYAIISIVSKIVNTLKP